MNYTVTSHQYENTGGNCMVSIFTVWLPQQNATRYVMVSDEGCGLYTADYIMQEVDYDETMQLDYCSNNELMQNDEYYALYLYCKFEHMKEDCKYWKRHMFIETNNLPQYLIDQMPAGYLAWLEDIGQLLETDGYMVFVDNGWRAIMMDEDPQIKEAAMFLQHLIACCDDPQDDCQTVSITVHGKTLTAYDHAALMQGLIDAVRCFIEEQ